MTSRFTVAIHILSLLDLNQGESITSEDLAVSVNTNPVVIRKILGILKKAGLIQIQKMRKIAKSKRINPQQEQGHQ